MKAIKFTLLALAFSLISPLSAHAFFQDYAAFYTVSAPGSTTPDSSFSLSQQPYLYVEYLPTTPPNITLVNDYVITSPNGTTYSDHDTTTTNQYWVSFSSADWNAIKTPGTWTITDTSCPTCIDTTTGFTGKTTFQVNAAPEPLGVFLFLTGGFIMYMSIVRRKKALATAKIG